MHAMWRDGTFYVGDPDATEHEVDAANAVRVHSSSVRGFAHLPITVKKVPITVKKV